MLKLSLNASGAEEDIVDVGASVVVTGGGVEVGAMGAKVGWEVGTMGAEVG